MPTVAEDVAFSLRRRGLTRPRSPSGSRRRSTGSTWPATPITRPTCSPAARSSCSRWPPCWSPSRRSGRRRADDAAGRRATRVHRRAARPARASWCLVTHQLHLLDGFDRVVVHRRRPGRRGRLPRGRPRRLPRAAGMIGRMIGLYSPGRSLMHRAPTLLKLVAALGGQSWCGVLQQPWQLGIAVRVCSCSSRRPHPAARRRRSDRADSLDAGDRRADPGALAGWLVAGHDGRPAVAAVALAALFTLTTTVTAVLEAFQRMLRPFGRWIDADRVGLLSRSPSAAFPWWPRS